MKAALLEDVKKMVVRTIPDPTVPSGEVLIRVRAVGVCGTDLHLFQGHGNYNFDAQGRPIPLTAQPQILGHEFSGEIIEASRDAKDLGPGDRVLCDQGRNCWSFGRRPLCPYCATGDSHQCQYYREHGITGLQGALAEYISVPAVNCLKLHESLSFEAGALVEPVGCITHASDCVDRASARARYTLDSSDKHPGGEPIRNILIFGAGPAGLLFLQYLRSVKRFDGLILVVDLREQNLRFVSTFGGTAVNAAKVDLAETVNELTRGERIHYLIEACGNAAVLKFVPSILRKQATVLIYGAGHKGQDISLLDPILFLEPTLVVSIGASGGFDADGRPRTYRQAQELVSSRRVQALPFLTHRYGALEDIHRAFEEDFMREDYIKGVLNVS
jgi:threonine dehydrogenase-like Zn-dependent dehydrogenase